MYLAVDIGGTKTLIASFSDAGKLTKTIRFETPQQYPDFIELFEKTFQENNFKGTYLLGVAGAPGKIARKEGVGEIFGNLPWENVPIGPDFTRITGTKFLIENDANLAGLSEAILVSKKFRKVLYVTVSTGIGGILIVDKRIDPELADTEFGHMMFEHQGKLQRWQEFASGKAIYAKFGMPARDITDPSAWYVISRNIAIGLINVIATLNPDAVIIGGGVGTHFEKFKVNLETELQILGSNMVAIPPVMAAQRAEEAVLYGCYELARQNTK